MNNRIICLFSACLFILSPAFSQDNNLFFSLVSTTSGVDVVFPNANKLNLAQKEQFTINGTMVTCQVSGFGTRMPRFSSPFYYEDKGSFKEFKFEDEGKYEFVIRGQKQVIWCRKPRKHILTVGVNGTGEKYPKLTKARKTASNFHKIVIDQSFLPDYITGHIDMPNEGSFSYDNAKKVKEAYQEAIRDKDIFILYFGGHGDTEIREGKSRFFLVLDDDKYLYEDELIDFLKLLPNSSKIILILATCKSGHLVHALHNSKLTNVSLLHSGDTTVVDGIFKELGSFLSKRNNELTLDGLFSWATDSIKNAGRYPNQTLDNNRNLLLFDKKIRHKKNNRLYCGIVGGLNHTPTPYVNLNLGVDINNHHKIEVGFTHSLMKSDEVYIYDNNGIMQNALQYKAMSIYARYGFNWFSLCKEKSRSEFVTFAGLSGNIVNGDNLSGFSSSIGKSAGSLMGIFCCRWAWNFSKENKRNVLLHITAGLDFPLKRDGNVSNVLIDEKYIKNWCTFRPYVEAGFIFNILKF